MLLSEFDYHLPPDLIAQHPLPERDASRMLIVERAHSCLRDAQFKELPFQLPDRSLLVVNNTKVFPARLFGQVAGHKSKMEALLIREIDGGRWEALVRPARAIRAGSELAFGDGSLRARVAATSVEGRRLLEFDCSREDLLKIVGRLGRVPLPPYIKRDSAEDVVEDHERYQTIFAHRIGAIAAPTAGLHFTQFTLAELSRRSIGVVHITHRVGYGTFQPVRCDQIEDHRMDQEEFEIAEDAAREINAAKREARPIYAVGTTTVRALESAVSACGEVIPGQGETSLFIHPPFRFRIIDGLLTNFHLPRSTLLMLVAALAGRDLVLQAYRHAVQHRYRFYSYGDCMLIQ